MTKLERIQQAIDWLDEPSTRRCVKIELGGVFNKKEINIWCYDLDLMAGQSVKDGEEINIPRVKEAQEKAEFERLKGKFGGEKQDE